jgi:3-hydroxymyristoyl/3-hydroxydecanoyl-(acyl carrier protein) dehydratase
MATNASCLRAPKRVNMEASYRIVSQADGTFAIERTEPAKEPVITGHFKTEAEARHHIADLKKLAPSTD